MLDCRIAIVTRDPYVTTVLWPHLLDHIAKVDLHGLLEPTVAADCRLVLADPDVPRQDIRGMGNARFARIGTQARQDEGGDAPVLRLDVRMAEVVEQIESLLDLDASVPNLPERLPGPIPEAVAEGLRSTFEPSAEETEPSRLRQLIDRFTS